MDQTSDLQVNSTRTSHSKSRPSHVGPSLLERRLRALMFGLFKPAVLGTFFYAVIAAIVDSGSEGVSELFSGWKPWLAGLIVLHFVLDHMLIEEIVRYRPLAFGIDIGLLLCLVVAFHSVNFGSESPVSVGTVSGSLGLAYLLFVLWEIAMRHELGLLLGLKLLEVSAASWFFLVAFVWRSAALTGFGLLVSTTALVVVGWRSLARSG